MPYFLSIDAKLCKLLRRLSPNRDNGLELSQIEQLLKDLMPIDQFIISWRAIAQHPFVKMIGVPGKSIPEDHRARVDSSGFKEAPDDSRRRLSETIAFNNR